MLQSVSMFAGGVVLLLLGGRLLVSSAVDTAKRLSVSPLLIGLTLVAWGTSAPELALNLISASKGRFDLAIGNIVGANICNMALVLGACALLRPLTVQIRLIRVEIWLNAAVLTFMAALGIVRGFDKWEAGLMLGVFGAYSTWTIMSALHARTPKSQSEATAQSSVADDPMREKAPMGWFMISTCFLAGLVLLGYGGALASDGASGAATAFGIPSAIVGVTVVAIGTTLPELVTGLLAVRNKQTDLAVGNAIGSCLFNAGAIFGLTGLVSSPSTGSGIVLPLAYMAGLAIALVPISRSNNQQVSRVEGAFLLASYLTFLILSAVQAAPR